MALRSEVSVLQKKFSSLSSAVRKMRQEKKDQEERRVSELRLAHQQIQQIRDERDRKITAEREVESKEMIQEPEATIEEMNEGIQEKEERSRLQDQGMTCELETWVSTLTI